MSTCVDCGRYFDPRGKTYVVRCFDCYKQWKAYCDAYDPDEDYIGRPRTETIVIDYGLRERLRQLLQLCHPDKHANSKTSTEITQWLLSIPKKG